MASLDGRVVIITGAGRGIGREYARFMAAEGAHVVVNDWDREPDGIAPGESAAEQVAAEIVAAGGVAIANRDDVADWDEARRLIDTTIAAFGDVHVLVNNAGILRDRTLVNMGEAEWDDVIRVHLKGHVAPTRWAAEHWRQQSKAGVEVRASVINTTSTSGLLGNPGQTNYGAAKAGIAALSNIAAQELARYGVRVNCVAPAARTRLTEATPGLGEVVQAPNEGFDVWNPANVAPLVAYLGTADCPVTGRTFFVQGGTVQLFQPWQLGPRIDRDDRWTVADLADELPKLAK